MQTTIESGKAAINGRNQLVNVIRVQFPFRIEQKSDTEIEIKMGEHGLTFINPDAMQRNYPWMNSNQIDELLEELYRVARNEAIRKAIVIK